MLLIQPLAGRIIRWLQRLDIDPEQIVVAHGALGFVAAALIADGARAGLILAAILLQLKTLLDNVDGGLARSSGKVTQLGRYLDTGIDFFVNIALFAALAVHGPGVLSYLALVLLTLLLTLDFNAEALYRERRATPQTTPTPNEVPLGGSALLVGCFEALYRLVFAPQDRLMRAFDRRLFRLAYGAPWASASQEAQLAWHDLMSTAALVNLGLSTQMLILGVCLAIGRPFAYVYSIFVMTLYTLLFQAFRVWRFRRRLALSRP